VAEGAGRRWGKLLLLAVCTMVFGQTAMASPSLLYLLPLALLLVAVPPQRPALMGLGIVLAVLALASPGTGTLAFAERGYALVLSAWFVLFVVFWPKAPFFSKALAALGGTAVTAATLVLFNTSGWAQLDWSIGGRMRDQVGELIALFPNSTDTMAKQFIDGLYQTADMQAMVYPALLALGSLAGLCLVWWTFRRLVTHGAVQPFAPLRDFRFRDELVWVLIVGLVLVLLPQGLGTRAGSNLLTFMGALYAVRGIAVVLALTGSPSVGSLMFVGVAMLVPIVPPLVMTATFVLGVTDTWLDLRSRQRATAAK
jgi:hypothetical protein